MENSGFAKITAAKKGCWGNLSDNSALLLLPYYLLKTLVVIKAQLPSQLT
jgi:hypothetical protein